MRESQIVVARLATSTEETIQYPATFEDAYVAWRERQRQMSPGGYVVWINEGDLWRFSGLLDNYPAACAIRDRVWGEGPSPEDAIR